MNSTVYHGPKYLGYDTKIGRLKVIPGVYYIEGTVGVLCMGGPKLAKFYQN